MAPPENDNRGDACQAFRQRIQNKSWRASLALSEPAWRVRLFLLCWCAWPVERLQAELTWLDTGGKGLLDTAFSNSLNPFRKARASLARLLHEAPGGRMKCLLDLVDASQHAEIIDSCRAMTLSFGAQITWRFREYDDWPRSWSVLFHPSATVAQKADNVCRFFSSKPCCRLGGVCDKVYNNCDGSADKFLDDADLFKALQGFVLGYDFTDMRMERLLASFHRWGKPCDCAEAVVACGTLSQLETQHNARGGTYLIATVVVRSVWS